MVGESGDLAEGEKLAGGVVEQTYLNSYVAHAPIETHSATAVVEDGKVTVWASTQAPFTVKDQVAQALGFRRDNVRVITPYVGGGFGGKSAMPRRRWRRRGWRRSPASPCRWCGTARRSSSTTTSGRRRSSRSASGMTAAGKIVLWDARSWAPATARPRPFYDIPHQRTYDCVN